MNKSIKSVFLISTLAFSATVIADEVINEEQNQASTIAQMFEKSTVSGNIKSMYAAYDIKKENENDIYATALGGYLKYETAELSGLSAAAAFAISKDIGFATGKKGKKHNDELSSSEGEYSALSEVYLTELSHLFPTKKQFKKTIFPSVCNSSIISLYKHNNFIKALF